MEPAWLSRDADEDHAAAAVGPRTLSVFKTMFGTYTYLVRGGGATHAGNVADLEAAKAAALGRADGPGK